MQGLDNAGNYAVVTPDPEVTVYSMLKSFILASLPYANLMRTTLEYTIQYPIIQNRINYIRLSTVIPPGALRIIGESKDRENKLDLYYPINEGPIDPDILQSIQMLPNIFLLTRMKDLLRMSTLLDPNGTRIVVELFF